VNHTKRVVEKCINKENLEKYMNEEHLKTFLVKFPLLFNLINIKISLNGFSMHKHWGGRAGGCSHLSWAEIPFILAIFLKGQ